MEILTTSYKKIGTGVAQDFGSATAYLEIWARYTSQDLINAKSKLDYQLRLVVTKNYIGEYTNANYTIHGTGAESVEEVSLGTGNFTSRVIGTISGEVEHDLNGDAKVSASGYVEFKAWGQILSVFASAKLPNIPRASQIGVANANIGQSTVITINKANPIFTTSLYYRVKANEGEEENEWNLIVDKTDQTTYAWEVPTSFYTLIPNSKTIEIEFKAITYSLNEDEEYNEIGTSKIITGVFTATGNPILTSKEIIDKNSNTIALTGNNQVVVKYASNIQATIYCEAQNNATISKIYVNDTLAELTTDNTGTIIGGVARINLATTNVFKTTIIDSRGNTLEDTTTLDYVDYVPVSINGSVVRNQPTDNKVKINVAGDYFNDTFGAVENHLGIQYRYRVKNGEFSEYISIPSDNITFDGNKYTITNYLASDINYQNVYEFELVAVDKVNTNGKYVTNIVIPKGIPLVNRCNKYYNFNTQIRQNNIPIDTLIANAVANVDMEILEDTGTETYGTYYRRAIKYANGLLINEIRYEYKGINVTTAWGSCYASGNISMPSWLEPFIEQGTMVVNKSLTPLGGHGWAYLPGQDTIDSPSDMGIARPNTSSNLTGVFNIIAFGYWKKENEESEE